MVVFSELMNVNVRYIGLQTGIVSTDLVNIVVDHSIEDIDQLDVLIVPGGTQNGMQGALENALLLDWVQRIDEETILTAGVGYGSLILAEADLLRDREITFSWPLAEENTLAIGSRFNNGRYTHDGKYWTSVSGTAVIDMGLAMVEAIAGTNQLQGAMLDLEYDPDPPLDGGTPETTPPDMLQSLLANTYSYDSLTLFDSSVSPIHTSNTDEEMLQIGILVYDGFFTLDAIGPLAVFSQLNNAEVQLIRFGDSEEIRSGRTRLIVPQSISDISALDLLVIPGGSDGTWRMVQNAEVINWIRMIDTNSSYTTSVCTGSWILGATGLLQDRMATTNWYRASQMMELFGAQFEPVRYTSDGKYWTSAGVSAGIDMSFALIAELSGDNTAQAAMMRLYYHPEPPIYAGTPETTDDLVLDMVHQMYDYLMVPLIRNYQMIEYPFSEDLP
jgi:transcriptional regulator GlxA family with amidase domain